MDDARTELAEAFLREAVYRSRASQAAITALRKPTSAASGNCGLGEKASVVLDLSERGQELFLALWRHEVESPALERIQDVMREWVEQQDALDRKRNHFLKEFRNKHGFDRTRYDAKQTALYEAGLTRINEEEDRARCDAAEQLVVVH